MASSASLVVASAAHSQKEAIKAALSGDSFESANPDSMMGISVAAARNRFSCGVDGGRNLGIRKVYQCPNPCPLRYINSDYRLCILPESGAGYFHAFKHNHQSRPGGAKKP